jgi:hypothetical protein
MVLTPVDLKKRNKDLICYGIFKKTWEKIKGKKRKIL